MSHDKTSTPLSILLFHSAMQRRESIAEFASALDIGVATLRSYLFSPDERLRPRSKTIDRMAEVLNMPSDEVRDRLDRTPTDAPPFGPWLAEQIKGRFTRVAIREQTRISESALKNYLSGQTTPDPDNAMRLAELLGAAPIEVARMVVASELRDRGAALATADVPAAPAADVPAAPAATVAAPDSSAAIVAAHAEGRLIELWRQLHPQGRRATLGYMAALLAEG